LAVPRERHRIILRNVAAFGIHDPELVLRIGVPLPGTRVGFGNRCGRQFLPRVHPHTGRERDEDGGEGDGPGVASSHGLSSDDHDDAGVDADPTAGGQGVQCGARGGAASQAQALKRRRPASQAAHWPEIETPDMSRHAAKMPQADPADTPSAP